MHLKKIPTPRGKLRSLPGTLAFVQPGDVVMLHSKAPLNQAAMESMQKGIKRVFPGHTVIVFSGGITLSTARPATTEAPTETQQHLRDAGLLTPDLWSEIDLKKTPGSLPHA